MKTLLLSLAALVMTLCIMMAVIYAELTSTYKTTDVIVRVQHGDSLTAIMNNLELHGLLSNNNKLFISLSLRVLGMDGALKVGEYHATTEDSPFLMIKKMIIGDYHYRKVLVPEGLTRLQILQILNIDSIVGEPIDLPEGRLLPDTYIYKYGDSKEHIMRSMASAMNSFLSDEWPKRDGKVRSFSKDEVLVLASIVEKESSLDDERNIIAAVFINRLALNMRLQADPTVIYAVTDGKGTLNRPLSRADLMQDHPFNTYKISGLPPEPICSPGKKSILAVLHPAEVNYLYFAKDRDEARHNFSHDYNTHRSNVNKMRA